MRPVIRANEIGRRCFSFEICSSFNPTPPRQFDATITSLHAKHHELHEKMELADESHRTHREQLKVRAAYSDER